MNILFGLAFIPYILGLGILVYMLILLADFLKAGKKAFEKYIDDSEKS